jgi:hypothetical protein
MKNLVVLAALAALVLVPAALARSSSTSQTVTCSGNGDNLPCRTSARLVCHRRSGRIVLSRIPTDSFQVWLTYKARRGGWQQSPILTPVGRKVSAVLKGVRRAKGYIEVPNPPPTAIPEMTYTISVRCVR